MAPAIENTRLLEAMRRVAALEMDRARELEAVLDAVREPIVVCDRDGQVRIANHAAETAFDGALPLTGDELRGRFVDAEGNDLRDAAKLPGTLLGNLRGTTRWFELNAYPVIEETGDTNDVASTIIVLRDVTELRPRAGAARGVHRSPEPRAAHADHDDFGGSRSSLGPRSTRPPGATWPPTSWRRPSASIGW